MKINFLSCLLFFWNYRNQKNARIGQKNKIALEFNEAVNVGVTFELVNRPCFLTDAFLTETPILIFNFWGKFSIIFIMWVSQ